MWPYCNVTLIIFVFNMFLYCLWLEFIFLNHSWFYSSLPPDLEVWVSQTSFPVAVQDRAVSYQSMMSEEGKQSAAPAPASTMDTKSESTASPPTGQAVSSVSPPVSTVTQPAPPATEDEEEESEDESEILEESPCGRWQKRREEVNSSLLFTDNATTC